MENKKLFIGALVVLIVLAGLFLYSRYQWKPTATDIRAFEKSVTAPEGKTATVPPEVIQKLTAPAQPVVVPAKAIEELTVPDGAR